jgi:maltose alpha-D-glucosyltransferase/alpha-amylase
MDSKIKVATLTESSPATSADQALWYKNAIIYELHVRTFADSNADGIGDFPGLTKKLGYLQDLGINTIWLLPATAPSMISARSWMKPTNATSASSSKWF